jgi:hypothetical protein
LFRTAVSNPVRTRATSHPCERGAGLLQKFAGSGVANSRLPFAAFFCGGVSCRSILNPSLNKVSLHYKAVWWKVILSNVFASVEYAAKLWLRLYFCKRVFSLW